MLSANHVREADAARKYQIGRHDLHRRVMFARVITAQAGADGFGNAVRLAQQQLPGARQQPGFQGFYLLTDVETGKLVTISLWETREQMEAVGRGTAAGIHHQAAMGVTAPSLETYEVTMRG
jgi:heme-degrading monooxygenase HmoA